MNLSPKSAALSALYDNCLFRSDSRAEAHEHVSRELSEHVLHWKQGAPDAALFKGEVNRLRIYALQYGAQVEVEPRPFEGFTLLHTSLSGGAEFSCDGHTVSLAEGRTAVLAPKKKCRLRWLAGTQQLIVRIPDSLLLETASSPTSATTDLSTGLLPRVLDAQWSLITQSLLNLMSIPSDGAVSPEWRDHFERSLAVFLLTNRLQEPPEHHETLTVSEVDTLSTGVREMDAVLEYITARLCAPISLEDLARAAGVSLRTLNIMCHRHYGVTPMNLLRNLRLDAVRSRLLTGVTSNITETALSFGFGHLGRFSAYYFARFNELPRDTQRRASLGV